MTTISATTTSTAPTTSVRLGLALSVLIGLGNLPMLLPSIEWTSDGRDPSYGFLVLAAVIGMVSVISSVIAWPSGNRRAIRINAAALIVNALMVVPGFFVDLTPIMTVLSAVFVVAPVVAVVLTMRRSPGQTYIRH